MNECINELRIKAAQWMIANSEFDEDTAMWEKQCDEQFAKLIIKECINTVVNTDVEGNNNAMLRGEIATRLTKHFGVEE